MGSVPTLGLRTLASLTLLVCAATLGGCRSERGQSGGDGRSPAQTPEPTVPGAKPEQARESPTRPASPAPGRPSSTVPARQKDNPAAVRASSSPASSAGRTESGREVTPPSAQPSGNDMAPEPPLRMLTRGSTYCTWSSYGSHSFFCSNLAPGAATDRCSKEASRRVGEPISCFCTAAEGYAPYCLAPDRASDSVASPSPEDIVPAVIAAPLAPDSTDSIAQPSPADIVLPETTTPAASP